MIMPHKKTNGSNGHIQLNKSRQTRASLLEKLENFGSIVELFLHQMVPGGMRNSKTQFVNYWYTMYD